VFYARADIFHFGIASAVGKAGISVCFYKPDQESAIAGVERVAGFKFSRLSPPAPEELIKAAARDATMYVW
jgi:hypothetical protein